MAETGPILIRVRVRMRTIPALLAIAFLAGCGNTGDLYLPEPDATGEVVTRPAPPPVPDATGGANSPQTADSPVVPPTPAPEVTEPEASEEKEDAAKPRP
jgi:predicted small lipoprotein YifL